MTAVLIVIHLILAISMIFIVLIQQSEGGIGGLGGGGGGGMGGFMTGRATANMLTRVTAVLAGLFMASSLALAIFANEGRTRGSILDQGAGPPANQTQSPAVPSLPRVPSLPPSEPPKP